jgi:FtsP/CotA-like multicopper oxidase with cupredoxin domain
VLPASTIYGFNGTFPGPMVNFEYGKPAIIRFENDLDLNPLCVTRGDFGAPDWAFLTHLHNGHTAPESDGQPNHMQDNEGGYQPAQWCDNLYLNTRGRDDSEASFLWFHDHRMHHTGPNVYKGMVGLMPHYDPFSVTGTPGLGPGDETKGLRLPGVRTDNGDGSFDVEYDIPMALYDCVLDDGVTQHNDEHTPLAPDPRLPGIVCGATHPEWWGQLFENHFVNHGFVGDIFTVNCTAFPTLVVKRRKYRLRFLGASLARQYILSIRSGTPFPFPGQQGQWNFGLRQGNKVVRDMGRVALQFRQIASEGGLLPFALQKQEIEIWPAKRREAIVDFSLLKSGDVVYLCNTALMKTGRKMDTKGEIGFTPNYCVPMMKIVVDGNAVDNSLMPNVNSTPLRPAPAFTATLAPTRNFTLQRGGSAGGETEWLINGFQFDPLAPLWAPAVNSFEHWGINNGGGGWTHPMHIHFEEHHVVFRSTNLPQHQDDTGKEDVVAPEGSEQTNIVRRFRRSSATTWPTATTWRTRTTT